MASSSDEEASSEQLVALRARLAADVPPYADFAVFRPFAQRLGLQSRHAYTITKVVEIRSPKVRGGIPLVRLRNPHGNSKEWRGDWSDE